MNVGLLIGVALYVNIASMYVFSKSKRANIGTALRLIVLTHVELHPGVVVVVVVVVVVSYFLCKKKKRKEFQTHRGIKKVFESDEETFEFESEPLKISENFNDDRVSFLL